MDGVHCWPLISMPSTKDELDDHISYPNPPAYSSSGNCIVHAVVGTIHILPKCETKDSLKNSRIYAQKIQVKTHHAQQVQQYRLAFLCVHVQCLWSGVTTGRQLLPVVEKSEKSTVNHILQYHSKYYIQRYN
jgi:hypothetical protein